ncbi:hypothetical protein [Methanospirillum sp.]|uniref:hypothetical protein n=1 Tax=Methanospirillum sp. TaxID=45200 RepID=UPI002D80ECFE|nr:hypothetical protein [Methanospirillum sp.]
MPMIRFVVVSGSSETWLLIRNAIYFNSEWNVLFDLVKELNVGLIYVGITIR